jgi:hypothetical protein
MSYPSFQRLHKLLATRINCSCLKLHRHIPKGGWRGGKFKPSPIPNGQITTSVHLASALQYFAGGSPYDLVGVYGISHTDVMDSVWHIVEAVNNYSKFAIEYPSSVEEQEEIVAGFQKASTVDFDICAGAIDGILIWTQKPTPAEVQRVGVGQKKSFVDESISLASIVKLWQMSRGRFLISVLHMVLLRPIVLPSRRVTYIPDLKAGY